MGRGNKDVEAAAGGSTGEQKHFNLETSELCEIMKERTNEGLHKLMYTYEGITGISNTLGVDLHKGENDTIRPFEGLGGSTSKFEGGRVYSRTGLKTNDIKDE